MLPLVLGSSSPFRAELLSKLGLPFEIASPDIDESAFDDETAPQLVLRLAEVKARTVSVQHPKALIIGSDQVAVCNGNILGKPGNHKAAIKQLQASSGKTVFFLTGLALYNSDADSMQSVVDPFAVHFRELNLAQIEGYLRQEQPYQCAGSFKSEGLGISLFEALQGDDPNSLVGLPLIQLIKMLENEGVDVLQVLSNS